MSKGDRLEEMAYWTQQQESTPVSHQATIQYLTQVEIGNISPSDLASQIFQAYIYNQP